MFTVGRMLLPRWGVGGVAAAIEIIVYLCLRRPGKGSHITQSMPQPPTHPSPELG